MRKNHSVKLAVLIFLLFILAGVIFMDPINFKHKQNFILFVSGLPNGLPGKKLTGFIATNPDHFVKPLVVVGNETVWAPHIKSTEFASNLLKEKVKRNEPEYIRELVCLTKDPDRDVRIGSIYFLSLSKAPEAFRGVLNSAEKDSDELVIYYAVQGLGRLEDERAFDYLTKRGLKHKNPLIRTASAESLAKIGTRRCIPPLLDMLKDDDEKVVYAVLSSLSYTAEPKHLDKIRPALNHKSAKVRECAKSAIHSIENDYYRIIGSRKALHILPDNHIPNKPRNLAEWKNPTFEEYIKTWD